VNKYLMNEVARMNRNIQHIRIKGNKGEEEVTALFDTGASRTLVRGDVAKRIGDAVKLPTPRKIVLGDGETKIEINEVLTLVIMLDGYAISCDADVIERLPYDVIIGIDTMREWGIVLNPRKEEIVTDEQLIERDEDTLEFYDEK